jgi:hypothetical protein
MRSRAVRLSSGTTICIENTIKVHIFRSPPAMGCPNFLVCFSSQEAGQREWRGAFEAKHSMDQRGIEKLAATSCTTSTIKFSEFSESLRIFGGHRVGMSPSFLMRDSSVVGLTSRSAAAPFDPRIRQLHCSTACRIIARSASSSEPAVAFTAMGRSAV